LFALALGALFAERPAEAHAQSTESARPVVLLLVESRSPRLVQLIRNELSLFGFDSQLIRPKERITSPTQVRDLAIERNAAAALRIHASSGGVEVWIADRMTGKTTMREMLAPGKKESKPSPRLIAIQTVELLRASLLEVHLKERPRAPVGVPPETKAHLLPAQDSKFVLSLGPAALWSPDRRAPSLQTKLGVSYLASSRIETGITASLPLLAPDIHGSEGSARVHMTGLGGHATLLLGDRHDALVPVVGFAADAVRTVVTAKASPGYLSQENESWRALGRIQGGANLGLARHISFGFRLWVGGTPSPVVVRFDGKDQATIGPVLLGATLELRVEL